MAATTTHLDVAQKSPRSSRAPIPEPFPARVLEWVVFVPVSVAITLFAVRDWHQISPHLWELLAWVSLVAAADLIPVRLRRDLVLALSLPVLLGAGMVYPASVAGLIAFWGSMDRRELRREISLPHSFYNRSQVALSCMAASFVFHSLGGDVDRLPWAVLAALVALASDAFVNLAMVGLATRIGTRMSPAAFLHAVHGNAPAEFLASYLCFGLLAVVLAIVFEQSGAWGLVVFFIPILLARQMFVRGLRLQEALESVSDKEKAFRTVSERIAEERKDERLSVAAELHDEVLPPLYKVHLMGQVLRQDLATGQLLALEDDLPALLRATEVASDSLRDLIRDLRRSPVGRGGLSETLRLLADSLKSETDAAFSLDLGDGGGSPFVQLLAYQVAAEALRNAVRHSGASWIGVSVVRDGVHLRLVVEDDGRGFDEHTVNRHRHFGLQLMRERVELVGGLLQIDSAPGRGTRVVVRLPAETVV